MMKVLVTLSFVFLAITAHAQSNPVHKPASGMRCDVPKPPRIVPVWKHVVVESSWIQEEYFFVSFDSRLSDKALKTRLCPVIVDAMGDNPKMVARVLGNGVRVSTRIAGIAVSGKGQRLAEALNESKLVRNAELSSMGTIRKLIKKVRRVKR